jgi:glycosyltransferase involved in cell wall biosynthesis
MPRVSIIVPTHNRLPLLRSALASIEAQSFRDFEVIVVNDGSTDGTAEWLRTKCPSVSVVDLVPSGGAGAARNRGVERATGELLAFLDDDDVWHPSYLAVQVACFDAHPDVELCTTGHIEIDPAGRQFTPDLRPAYRYGEPYGVLLAECPIHTMSLMACRSSAFRRIGFFDETLSVVHDLDWYLRLLLAGGTFQHSPEALISRSVPGGLVTQYRRWFAEERVVHQRFFAAASVPTNQRRNVMAARDLFFARLGFAKGDFAFGFARLLASLLGSPAAAITIAVRRLFRRMQAAGAANRTLETGVAR